MQRRSTGAAAALYKMLQDFAADGINATTTLHETRWKILTFKAVDMRANGWTNGSRGKRSRNR